MVAGYARVKQRDAGGEQAVLVVPSGNGGERMEEVEAHIPYVPEVCPAVPMLMTLRVEAGH